jgi:competence protein ComGC
MNIRTTKPQLAAFTRLELFVAISVIVILVGLLLPALAKAKSKSSKISCSTNLKQIALLSNIFTEDNNGFYPFGITRAFP